MNFRVGRDGLLAYDRRTAQWFACSRRPRLAEWCARRDTLAEAEAALADAHEGHTLPEDVYDGTWPR